jgi:hypothetical protein
MGEPDDILNQLLSQMNKAVSGQGKISFLQTALNLTICSINTKRTPEDVVKTYFEVCKQLLKQKQMSWE